MLCWTNCFMQSIMMQDSTNMNFLASLSPIFEPDLVVIGGGVAHAGEVLLSAARTSYQAHGAAHFVSRVGVVAAELGGFAGVVGAAALAVGRCDGRTRGDATA